MQSPCEGVGSADGRFAPEAAVHSKQQLFVGFTSCADFSDGNSFLDLRLLRGLRMVKSATMTSRRSFRVAISPIIGFAARIVTASLDGRAADHIVIESAASDLAPVA